MSNIYWCEGCVFFLPIIGNKWELVVEEVTPPDSPLHMCVSYCEWTLVLGGALGIVTTNAWGLGVAIVSSTIDIIVQFRSTSKCVGDFDFPSWVVTTILDPLLHFAASSIRVCLIWLSSTIFSCSSSTSTRFHLDLSNYSSGGKNVRWQSRNQKHSLKIVNFHVLTWDGLIMQRTPPPLAPKC